MPGMADCRVDRLTPHIAARVTQLREQATAAAAVGDLNTVRAAVDELILLLPGLPNQRGEVPAAPQVAPQVAP